MSSWLRAKSAPIKKALVIPYYHDTTSSLDIISIYLDFLGAYSFNQKMGQICNVWDPTGVINSTLRYNPQIRILKEKPEESQGQNMDNYLNTVSNIKYVDIKRYATNIFLYDLDFNQSVIKVLEKASIKSVFDIGIHLVPDIKLSTYVDYIKAFQKKSKKETLTIYAMTTSYDLLKAFQSIS